MKKIEDELQSGFVHFAGRAQALNAAELTKAFDIEQSGIGGLAGGGAPRLNPRKPLRYGGNPYRSIGVNDGVKQIQGIARITPPFRYAVAVRQEWTGA